MAGRYDNTKRNQYNSTPRKVFDSYIDRMAIKRARDNENHRADILNLVRQIKSLEDRLTQLTEHVAQHCLTLTDEAGMNDHPSTKGNEELG